MMTVQLVPDASNNPTLLSVHLLDNGVPVGQQYLPRAWLQDLLLRDAPVSINFDPARRGGSTDE